MRLNQLEAKSIKKCRTALSGPWQQYTHSEKYKYIDTRSTGLVIISYQNRFCLIEYNLKLRLRADIYLPIRLDATYNSSCTVDQIIWLAVVSIKHCENFNFLCHLDRFIRNSIIICYFRQKYHFILIFLR